LTTNGLSLYKEAPLHALVDFHLSFQEEDQDDFIDLEEQTSISATASSSQGQLSKTHQSIYSTWDLLYALNAVTEAGDVSNLEKTKYFSLLLDE